MNAEQLKPLLNFIEQHKGQARSYVLVILDHNNLSNVHFQGTPMEIAYMNKSADHGLSTYMSQTGGQILQEKKVPSEPTEAVLQ